MRDSGLQRSVRARRFFREPGDAPNLGRVAKLRGSGLPRGQRRVRKRGSRGRRSKGAQRKSVVLAWSLLILGGTFLLLGFFTLSWLRSQMRAKQDVQHAVEEKKSRIESRFPSPSQEEAVSLVKNALAARDPVNVLAYFRTGTSTIPEIIQFLAALPGKMGEIKKIQWLSSLDANDLLLEGLMIVSELDGEELNRLVLLTPDEEGIWKVDYESFARKVEPSWDELIGDEAATGRVRVIFAADNYYNGPFSDDQKWTCFAMASPDIESILMGYTRVGSPQDTALRRLLLRGASIQGNVQRVTLEIKKPADSVERQFQITRVLAEDWVLTDQAFDRSRD